MLLHFEIRWYDKHDNCHGLDFCTIYVNPTGFESSLLRVTRIWYEAAHVVAARSIFSIRAPKWLQRRVFGIVIEDCRDS